MAGLTSLSVRDIERRHWMSNAPTMSTPSPGRIATASAIGIMSAAVDGVSTLIKIANAQIAAVDKAAPTNPPSATI